MHEVIVDSRIRIARPEELPEQCLAALRAEFTYENPDHAELRSLETLLRRVSGPRRRDIFARYMAAKNAPEFIVLWREEEGCLTLPRGGLAKVREALYEGGVEARFVDRRTEGRNLGKFSCSPSVTLYDFQEAMVETALEKQCGMWRSPTGSGKSTAALALAARVRMPTLVIVWRGSLFDQWTERIESELGIPREDVGIIRGGEKKLRPITVGMQQTLYNCIDDEGITSAFGCVILDESDRAAARTVSDVVDAFPAKYRIGVSADERRRDRKEFISYDVFGPVIADVKRDLLVKRNIVLDVDVRLVETQFEAPWYVELPGKQKAYAHNDLLAEMTKDGERNSLAVELAKREAEAGEQVLMFSHRVEHCGELVEQLGADVSSGSLIGGVDNSAEFARTVDGVKAGSVNVAVGTYQAIGLGLDLPSVSRGVCVTPTHTNKMFFNQVRGRICRTSKRTGKTGAVLYYLWDRKLYGMKPLQNLIAWNPTVTVEENGQVIDGRQYLSDYERALDPLAPRPLLDSVPG